MSNIFARLLIETNRQRLYNRTALMDGFHATYRETTGIFSGVSGQYGAKTLGEWVTGQA
jgi:hypothetical protein